MKIVEEPYVLQDTKCYVCDGHGDYTSNGLHYPQRSCSACYGKGCMTEKIPLIELFKGHPTISKVILQMIERVDSK